jgi:adenine deaminase
VAGEDGLRAMVSNIDKLPMRLLLEVPSRVPTAPGLETTGAVLGPEEVRRIMDWPQAISLGELDPSKILFVKEEYIQKVTETLAKRKIVNGHAIGRLGQELNVYASSGISDDHETVLPEEMMERLRVGMKVFIREGSTERNLDALVKGVLDNNLSIDNICFCTDDKHPNEISAEGHINYNVRRAQELGMKAMDAIRIATVNAAKHFRIEDEIGSITPRRLADILIIPDLSEMKPSLVFFEGRMVEKDGSLTQECEIPEYPSWIKDTVHLKNPITAQSFGIRSRISDGRTKARVIQMIDRQIINECVIKTLPVKNGLIERDLSQDILKLAVVERYGKTGGVGVGFVKGFNLSSGALAFSTSHDHHNIVVIGVDDESMAAAVNEIARIHGGCSVAKDGKVIASMQLVLGGLMSDKTAPVVMKQIEEVNKAALSLGCGMKAPFMALSFISLPTVPELGLTDIGLIDVLDHKLIDVEI